MLIWKFSKKNICQMTFSDKKYHQSMPTKKNNNSNLHTGSACIQVQLSHSTFFLKITCCYGLARLYWRTLIRYTVHTISLSLKWKPLKTYLDSSNSKSGTVHYEISGVNILSLLNMYSLIQNIFDNFFNLILII